MYFGDGYVDYFTGSTSHTYNLDSSGYICVTLYAYDTTQSNCYDTMVRCIYVKGCEANASFTSRDSSGTFIFTNTSIKSNKYKWEFGDGNYSTSKNAAHRYAFGFTRNLRVTLHAWDTTLKNCEDTIIRTITVQGCNAQASFLDSSLGAYKVYFKNYSKSGNKYKWDFGDGSSKSTLMSPNHTYSSKGTYVVKLLVTDTVNNCKDSVLRYVIVNFCSIKAGFSVKDSAGVFYFTNTSTGATNYKWNFGDYNYSYLKSPSHAYTKSPSRTVNVSLKIWDTSNSSNCYDSINKSVFIQGCNALAAIGFSTFGYSASFFNFYNYSGTTYTWHFGDGSTSTSRTPTHTYSSLGYKTVKLVVKDSVGNCMDSSSYYMNLTGCTAKAGFTVKDSAGVYYFTNTSTGVNVYNWYFGDGTYSTSMSPSHTYAKGPARTIKVWLYATDTSKSCSDSIWVSVYIKGCNANTNFTYKTFGTRADFSHTAIGGTKYKWDFGDGSGSSNSSPSHTYSSYGSYTVKLIAKDSANNCQDSMIRTVTVNACVAYAGFTVKDSIGVTYFTNTSTGSNSYTWNFGDANMSTAKNPVHIYSNSVTASYNVRLYVRDTGINNCRDSIIQLITVKRCNVKANFTFSKSALNVSFSNTSSNGNKYIWNFGDAQISTSKNPTHTYAASGTYNVSLKSMDTTMGGCVDSITRSITVYDCGADAYFTFTDSNNLIYFHNKSSGTNKYKWSFGDGGSSTSFAPTHRYSGSTNTFLVTLIAYDTSKSNCTDTGRTYVYFNGCNAYYTIEPDTSSTFSALLVNRTRSNSTASYVWDFGDGDSSHSKTPTHVYAGMGPYILCLSVADSSCSSNFCDTLSFDSSGNLNALMIPFSIKVVNPGKTITSIDDATYANQLKLYPNPASAVIHLESETKTMSHIHITDIQGKDIVSQEVSGQMLELNIKDLSPGLYIIHITYDSKETVRLKWIKN